ncbi:hypothetical protein TB2_046832 [Malus domestica]
MQQTQKAEPSNHHDSPPDLASLLPHLPRFHQQLFSLVHLPLLLPFHTNSIHWHCPHSPGFSRVWWWLGGGAKAAAEAPQ